MYDIRRGQTNIDCVELSKLILKKEPEIIKKYPPTGFDGTVTDGNTGLGTNSTTSRFYHYNVLNWEGTDHLRHYIKLGYETYTGLKDAILKISQPRSSKKSTLSSSKAVEKKSIPSLSACSFSSVKS